MDLANKKYSIDIDTVRERAKTALGKIKPADDNTRADNDFLLRAQRSDAGRMLPPYYLVYFLLVDLLGFKNLGKFEKIAWSVPIDYNGEAFLIEYRKFGVGVFVHDKMKQEADAAEIVRLIQKAVKAAEPYFKFLPYEALKCSEFNIKNRGLELFCRFEFFLAEFRAQIEKDKLKTKLPTEKQKPPTGIIAFIKEMTGVGKQADWLGLAAIDAFYSWTEHIFIHLAILSGNVSTGEQVAKIIGAEWAEKFKSAMDITDRNTKIFFDDLCTIRRQLRNFIAHGAFGKEGEAFRFHSGTGAVPVRLYSNSRTTEFSLHGNALINNADAITTIENFIRHLWSGKREPAKLYIQESELPTIMTYAQDGRYDTAMKSTKKMKELIDELHYRFDQATNMDW